MQHDAMNMKEPYDNYYSQDPMMNRPSVQEESDMRAILKLGLLVALGGSMVVAFAWGVIWALWLIKLLIEQI